MDEQDMYNQQNAIAMGRTAYMNADNSGINTLLSDLTNVDSVIEEVELLLQGKIINSKGQEEQTCEPLCNKECAANMKRSMKALTSKIVLMSNFEEEQVRTMTIEVGFDLIEDLTLNKVKYGIKQPKAISTIANLVLVNGFSCAMSAMENGTRKMLKGNTMETTINTQGAMLKQGKGGGGISSILGFGRK